MEDLVMPPPGSQAIDRSFWRGRRVLLTGHTGFKGGWLALWLLELGATVHGFALPPPPGRQLYRQLDLEHSLAGSTLADLNDPAALEDLVRTVRPEVVLHLAAQPLVRRSHEDPLGTWRTNVLGSLQLLEALRPLNEACAVVMVTTDKVYDQGDGAQRPFQEGDRLGGHDPYSASKAAMELAVASWRASFCGDGPRQNRWLAVATARAGNVIGGGDWAVDRIVPDAMRALADGQVIGVRRPEAVRPWQHVLDPLAGYLLLAERLQHQAQHGVALAANARESPGAWNFGPVLADQCSVAALMEQVLRHWPGRWQERTQQQAPHEAACLRLDISHTCRKLGWQPTWPLETAVARTVRWYRRVHAGADPRACCLEDLTAFSGNTDAALEQRT